MTKKNVAILGMSNKPERFSYKAHFLLKDYGHETFLISPNLLEFEGQKVFTSLKDIPENIDTLTIYIRPELSNKLIDEILSLKPRRVILNPGAENQVLEKELGKQDIKVQNACTLVLLNTNQF